MNDKQRYLVTGDELSDAWMLIAVLCPSSQIPDDNVSFKQNSLCALFSNQIIDKLKKKIEEKVSLRNYFVSLNQSISIQCICSEEICQTFWAIESVNDDDWLW